MFWSNSAMGQTSIANSNPKWILGHMDLGGSSITKLLNVVTFTHQEVAEGPAYHILDSHTHWFHRIHS